MNQQTLFNLPDFVDSKKIIVKNLPKSFTHKDIDEFFKLFGATNIEYFTKPTKSVVVKFPTEQLTKDVLSFLHQKPILDSILRVEYFTKKNYQNKTKLADTQAVFSTKTTAAATATPTPTQENNSIDCGSKVNNFLKKLYSTDQIFNFEQPPPPYLKYCYPKLNRDISDSISIALETCPKFYYQVLHLMNRMNLPPPFVPGANNLQFPCKLCDVAVQTDNLDYVHLPTKLPQQKPNKKRHHQQDLASDESELESDTEISNPPQNIKRKKQNPQQIKKQKIRIRSILESEKNKTTILATASSVESKKEIDLSKIFDNEKNRKYERNIKIVAPDQISNKKPEIIESTTININIESVNELPTVSHTSIPSDAIQSVELLTCLSLDELKSNQIPETQRINHPLFLNYNSGERSNKLYIKNLAKTVCEEDLLKIYRRYTTGENQGIDLRLMQTGRMKGQAFVTFLSPYLEEENYDIVAKALDETNGFILKDKIMVVMFGKKSNTSS